MRTLVITLEPPYNPGSPPYLPILPTSGFLTADAQGCHISHPNVGRMLVGGSEQGSQAGERDRVCGKYLGLAWFGNIQI